MKNQDIWLHLINMDFNNRKNKGKIIDRNILFVAIAIIFVILFSLSFIFRSAINEFIMVLAQFIKAKPLLGVLAFIGFSALSALISPLSSVSLVPSSILTFGKLATFFLLISGWLLGSVVGYYIGRYFGRKIIAKFMSLKRIDYYAAKIPAKSRFLIILIFRLVVPSEIAVYTLGIIKYDFWKYVLISVLAEIPLTLAAVFSSSALNQGDIMIFIFPILTLGAIIFFLSAYLKRMLDKT